ncbi:MAG: Nif3-like dinuclear metal center hexameric protein [Saprospirales bacterium]|nr:MAG: Nif3-like dinuclear metal center hexameric protein [Saprospirales bacterium]
MTQIKEVLEVLENIAPAEYQESYDNSGLLVGNKNIELKGVLVCLDTTEEIVDEAVEKDCNLIIAHHPLIFKGLKKIDPNHWVGRVVIKAIKSDIAIYAIHTNLDNVLKNGVNAKIAEKLGLTKTKVLMPSKSTLSFSIKSPILLKKEVLQATDKISPLNYSYSESTNGNDGKKIVEVIGEIAPHQKSQLSNSLKGLGVIASFNELTDRHPDLGAGLIGELEMPVPEKDFLSILKKQFKTAVIRHTELLGKSVLKVAICGGSGSFLLPFAIGAGADVFVTGDFKYHDFFEADRKILVADIGHFESEQYTIELIIDIIKDKFSTFALHYTQVDTNPVKYF